MVNIILLIYILLTRVLDLFAIWFNCLLCKVVFGVLLYSLCIVCVCMCVCVCVCVWSVFVCVCMCVIESMGACEFLCGSIGIRPYAVFKITNLASFNFAASCL